MNSQTAYTVNSQLEEGQRSLRYRLNEPLASHLTCTSSQMVKESQAACIACYDFTAYEQLNQMVTDVT